MVQLKKIAEFIRKKYQSTVHGSYDGEKYVHNVEMISEITDYDSDTLYLCGESKKSGWTLPLPDTADDICLITDSSTAGDIPAPFQTIVFSKLPPAEELCGDIRQMIRREAVLEHQINLLYASLTRGSGLKDVIALAETYMKSPISVCDTSYNFIQTSPMMQHFPYGVSTGKTHGYLSGNEIESLKRNNFESMIYQRHSAFFINSPDHPDNQWIFCAIRIQNVMVGYVAAAVEKDRVITEYDLRLITALADICAVEMQKHDFFVTRTGLKYETFLIDLLEGQFHDVNMISTRLQLLDRKFCKYFCIMVLKCTEPHDSDLFNKRQISNLRHNYPNSMSVVYKDAIVFFLNQDTPISLDAQFTEKLEEFARLNHMHVGISQPFSDILKIQIFYQQALNTLELGESQNSESYLYFAPDLFPMYLFRSCDDTGLETGIHYHIHRLQDYDSEYHTEFLQTLRAYLENDRNATRAAEALHIHRSTFFYRVKKIEELLNISFSDSRLMFLYELSLKAWDYLCR